MFFQVFDDGFKTNSVDALMMLHLLKHYEFEPLELIGQKGEGEIDLLKERAEFPITTEMDHWMYLKELVDEDDRTPIMSATFKISEDEFVSFQYGELSVKIKDEELLQEFAIRLLETYHYPAANKVWEYCKSVKGAVPVYIMQCITVELWDKRIRVMKPYIEESMAEINGRL